MEEMHTVNPEYSELFVILNIQRPTVLLRNNLTLRSRSICVQNASGTRSERVPFAFHLRSERVPNAFRTRSKMRSKAFQTKLGNAFPSLVKYRVLTSGDPDSPTSNET